MLRSISATWRVHTTGLDVLEQLADSRRRHILVFWHRHYIALFRLFRDRRIAVVTNRSERGHVIANICRRNQMRTVQVSVNGGTRSMLENVHRATDQGYGLGITGDGPFGPAKQVKKVVPKLAARLACPIVPISVVAKQKYAMTSRWDGLEIPYPFSRVSFVIGDPIQAAIVGQMEPKDLAILIEQQISAGELIGQKVTAETH